MFTCIRVNQFNSSIKIIIYTQVLAIKRNKSNTTKKIDIPYFCFIVNDFWAIVWALSKLLAPVTRELTNVLTVDLTECAISKITMFTINSNALNTISWKYFRSKSLGSKFAKFPMVQISRIWVISFKWETFSFSKCRHVHWPGWQMWHGLVDAIFNEMRDAKWDAIFTA